MSDVRVGKVIDLEIVAESKDAALAATDEMCRKLLANPVTEDFELEYMGAAETVE